MYVYDEYFDEVEYRTSHHSATNRDVCREYKSRAYLCKNYLTRGMCTENAKCEKAVRRHIWQNYVEMAEHVRYVAIYKELYHLRKEKINRVFAGAKEKHGMRYTQYRDLAQVTNWVKLKFVAINLKNWPHENGITSIRNWTAEGGPDCVKTRLPFRFFFPLGSCLQIKRLL